MSDVSHAESEQTIAPAFCIVANVVEGDGIFRDGAKCYLIGGTGGEGWHKFRWFGMSAKRRRRVEKWCPTERMANFRAAWIPPFIRGRYDTLYLSGSREQMEALAAKLNAFRSTLDK